MKSKYSMLIRWSDEDGVYVVYLPEFNCTGGHGDTYEEAAKSGQECLDILTLPENLARYEPVPDRYEDDRPVKPRRQDVEPTEVTP